MSKRKPTTDAGQGDVMGASGAAENTQVHAAPAVVPGKYGGTLTPIRSSERGRELARIRYEKRTRAALAGVGDAARLITDTGAALPDGQPITTAYDVIRFLVSQHALNAADPTAQGATQSLKVVDGMAFPAPEKVAGPAPIQQFNQYNISAEAARALLAEMRLLSAEQG